MAEVGVAEVGVAVVGVEGVEGVEEDICMDLDDVIMEDGQDSLYGVIGMLSRVGLPIGLYHVIAREVVLRTGVLFPEQD